MENRCLLIFQALSDETRQKILAMLKNKSMCVSEIKKRFEMTQPSISHHLDILKRAGLVSFKKKGREVYYCCTCCCLEVECKDFLKKLGMVIKEKKQKKK